MARPGAYPDDPPFVTAKSLDTTLLPQDIHCPLLADSSQMAAIFSAAKGKDFVLIGPPGTGKSQTIANMIAQCLSEKKTVLFVAEKTAALNVVYRRLKKIGLGDFCLEMHSNKANKATVLAQLAAATDRHSTREQSEWAQLATRLCRTRDTLNAYVRNLHQIYRNGLTPFIAMRAEQISLQQTRAQGVRDLRLFLEFTEKGIQALAGATQHSTGEFESPFEEAVAQALEANGWEVHPQVGVSAFRVDLGIVDPDAPGAYLAGVECDGATYHSSATARDRDRLRESVLRGLGWEIVRIWSTDWWMQRNAALERLNNELKSLLVARRQERERQEALRHDHVRLLPRSRSKVKGT